jgi:hypothetical protein
VSPEVSGPSYHPESNSPEALLDFLSRHRERADRGRKPQRRTGGRGWKIVLLALVAAVVLVGGGLLIRHAVTRQSSDTAAPKTAAVKQTAGRIKRRVSHHGATKKTTQQTALPDTKTWNQGFHPWGPSTGGRPANFYYEWVRSHISCARGATHGCWKINVATRHGCPHGVAVFVSETSKGVDLGGAAFGFSPPLGARVQDVVEVNKTQDDVAGRVRSIVCRPNGQNDLRVPAAVSPGLGRRRSRTRRPSGRSSRRPAMPSPGRRSGHAASSRRA